MWGVLLDMHCWMQASYRQFEGPKRNGSWVTAAAWDVQACQGWNFIVGYRIIIISEHTAWWSRIESFKNVKIQNWLPSKFVGQALKRYLKSSIPFWCKKKGNILHLKMKYLEFNAVCLIILMKPHKGRDCTDYFIISL